MLSDSTEEYDRGEKFESYRSLVSLEEYVLVSQNERRIETFSRRDGWAPRVATSGHAFDIPAIDVRLSVDDIY